MKTSSLPGRLALLSALACALGSGPHSRAQSLDAAPVAVIRAVTGQQTIRTLDNAASARVTDPGVARISVDDANRVVLTAVAPGQTFLTYRTAADAPVSERIIVSPPLKGVAAEIQNLVADIPGVSVYEANKRIVLDGRLPSVTDVDRVGKIAAAFGEQILDLTRLDTGTSNDVIADFIRRNAGVTGLEISILGDTAYIRGPVPNETVRSNVLALARTQVANVMDLLEVRETMIETEVLFIRAEKTKGRDWGVNLFDGGDLVKMSASTDGSKDYAQNVWSPVAIGVNWSLSIAPVINALVSSGKAEVVARPRVGTRLGQKGRFLSGGEMYYKVSGEVSGDLESVEYGIDLSVVPQFLADNTICNALTMTLSFPVTQAGTSDLSLDKYTIESTIVCKIGQSIVISGIAEQITNDQESHTPFLGSIPGVRLLFSNTQNSRKDAEIIAIITPRVMDAALADERLQTAEPRINELDAQRQQADLQASTANLSVQDRAARREAALAAKKARREAALAEKQAAREAAEQKAAAKKAAADAALAEKQAARKAAEQEAARKKAEAEALRQAAAEARRAEKAAKEAP